MTADQQLEAILDKLHGELRSRYGQIGKIQDELKVNKSYFSDQRARQSVDLTKLLKTLEIMGLDAAVFFFEALDGDPANLSFGTIVERVKDAGVDIARARLKELENDEQG